MGAGNLSQPVHVSYCLSVLGWSTYSVYPVIDCGTPPTVSNASPGTPTNTLLNGMVTYTCDIGYEVSTGVTTATATCMANDNWEPLPTCSCKMRMFRILMFVAPLLRPQYNMLYCLELALYL